MKLKKLNHRTTALVLAFLILLTSIPFLAAGAGNEAGKQEPDVPFSFTLEEGDLPFSELADAVLDPCDLPDVIGADLAAERDHVNRLYAQEPDDYTVMFQNRDGSKTTYVFSKPVKSGRVSLSVSSLTTAVQDAFSFSPAGFDYKSGSSLRALDRLDKSYEGGKIYYYNIGYAEITKTAGRLTSSGTDMTEYAREWALGKVVPGDRLSSPSGQVVNEEEPGSYVLMYTASEMAGIVNLENYYSQTYLKNNSLTPTLSSANPITLKTPAFRWVLQYCNSSKYLIKSMVGFHTSTRYMLKYDSAFTSVSLSTGNISNAFWQIDAEEDGDGIMYYYLRPRASGGSGKALNNTLGFSNASMGSCTDQCGWEIFNKRDIPVSITPKQNALIAVGADITSVLNVVPSGAEMIIDWGSEGNNLIEYSGDDDYDYITTSGKHHIWLEERYSGILVEEEDDWYVLAYDNYNVYDNNRTYMIRPYISDNTNYATSKLLTLNQSFDDDPNDFSLIQLYNGNNSTYSAKWTDKSQTFTFSFVENGQYNMGATLTIQQYEITPHFVYYNSDFTYNNSKYNINAPQVDYTMKNCDNISNWVSNSGAAVTKQLSASWYIIPNGTVCFSGTYYEKIIIALIDNTQTVKALKHNTDDTICVANYSDSDCFSWIINKVGINVPLIKQTNTRWCGYATLLQTIYGAGTQQELTRLFDPNSTLDRDQLHNQMDRLKAALGYYEAMSQEDICDDLNGGEINSHIFPNSTVNYESTDGKSVYEFHNDVGTNTQQKFINLINSSLDTGWAPFFLTATAGTPYAAGGDGTPCHYISIIGYDQISDTVLIANPHYADGEFRVGGVRAYIYGLYAVSAYSLYNSNVTKFFYSYSVSN